MELRTALEELCLAHRAIGSPLFDCFFEPATPSELSGHGVPVDSELAEMYRVANGIDLRAWAEVAAPGTRAALYPGGPTFPSLDEAAAAAARVQSQAEGLGDVFWRDEWRLAWPMGKGVHLLVVHQQGAELDLVEVWWEAWPTRAIEASMAEVLAYGTRQLALVDARWNSEERRMEWDVDRYLRYDSLP